MPAILMPYCELRPLRIELSIIPVIDTPNNRSSSVFFCHMRRKYGKLVKVDCQVPKIVAIRTLRLRSSTVSSPRTIISDKLQNWYGRKIISLQGFVPNSYVESRLPFSAAFFCAAPR